MSNSTKNDDEKFIENAGWNKPVAGPESEELSPIINIAVDMSKELIVVVISYVISFVFIALSFYKITSYRNSDFDSLRVNAYVGGDGYNYIINGTHGTTYAIIGVIFAIIGSAFLIVNAINKK